MNTLRININDAAQIPLPPSPKANRASELMAEFSVAHFSDCSGDEDTLLTPECICDYWERMGEDFSDCYDAEWYGLVMVKAVKETIDWEYVCDAVCDACPQWLRSED